MSVTKESILAYRPKLTPIDVPEWGGTVYVRVISGSERDAYEQSSITGRGKNANVTLKGMRGRLVALCVVNSEGVRYFSDEEAAAVGELPSDVLDPVFALAQRVNAITKEDIDELAGNSQSAPANSSGTI